MKFDKVRVRILLTCIFVILYGITGIISTILMLTESLLLAEIFQTISIIFLTAGIIITSITYMHILKNEDK